MADILIRGMEMPKDRHTITITICHDGYTVVEFRDNGLFPKEIETYKTIPIQEGYGRLGDTVNAIADRIYAALDALDRGTNNDWAREALEEANQILGAYYKKEVTDNG